MKTIACAMEHHNVCSSQVVKWTGKLAGQGERFLDDCLCECHRNIIERKRLRTTDIGYWNEDRSLYLKKKKPQPEPIEKPEQYEQGTLL